MNNETCIHGGISPQSFLRALHNSQAGSGRHRCPTCAYELGFILGSSNKWKTYLDYCNSIPDPEKCQKGNIAPASILEKLGGNQGGTGRHKCTNCAFKEGFEIGNSEKKFDFTNLSLVSPPKNVLKSRTRYFKAYKNIDFIQSEIENRKLGLLGELFIIQYEKNYLISSGREDLAEKIEHSSIIKGDGIGYDIIR